MQNFIWILKFRFSFIIHWKWLCAWFLAMYMMMLRTKNYNYKNKIMKRGSQHLPTWDSEDRSVKMQKKKNEFMKESLKVLDKRTRWLQSCWNDSNMIFQKLSVKMYENVSCIEIYRKYITELWCIKYLKISNIKSSKLISRALSSLIFWLFSKFIFSEFSLKNTCPHRWVNRWYYRELCHSPFHQLQIYENKNKRLMWSNLNIYSMN